MSLMKKFQARMGGAEPAAAASKSAAVPGGMTPGMIGRQQLEALLTGALDEDLKGLHELQSVERKIQVKREQLLPKYREYVERLRSLGLHHDLLGYYLVWLFDCGEIEPAVELGLWCAEQGVSLPERFRRPLVSFVAGGVLEWAETQHDSGRSAEPYFSRLFELAAGPGADGGAPAWDLPDAMRAGYYRLRGLIRADAGDHAGAVAALERALQLGAKVKTVLAEQRRKLPDEG